MKNPRKSCWTGGLRIFLLSLLDGREGDITEGKVDFCP
ncbi:hypothetical protein CLOBOL_02790 [Enterocloster bolteae ATCC BAA-613]|uniref:Uncharacterized protein n=1 Tax=Enterocloster bolteae (strain ATCC BAA-613 / DSM 15670 / CCUG 46953 / JCM 12243 / WAL 16351) TaxID=411902 RepID=A8RQN9_ENTBW|nr:hypothetical protein CLOBOL_02790 [Enterocloster bolteae ATCC BAA-613]